MIDYSQCQTTSAVPAASSMIETFRAIGYNLQTAIADIIDNSISAGAKNVWIEFEWTGSDTWISIKDDGSGMSNDELIQAMRPGSKNPTEERSPKDLGRFGLGLKTSSFSQCRRLSVVSKRENEKQVFWTWDLDFVNKTGEWDLIQYLPAEFEGGLKDVSSGTVVIWNDLDRLVSNFREDDKSALSKFLEIMEHVKSHLSMVFHRFIEGRRVKIEFQQRIIEAWNPFLIENTATQKFPDEPIQNNKVRVKGFVLPHKSKLGEVEYRKAEGPRGWNEQQGFYIYRNDRLLVPGDWLGMFRKQEHYKLARIAIDLPNNLDAEWQIDIRKAIARPPFIVRDQLKAYATKVIVQAIEVLNHKGKVLQRKYAGIQFQPVWREKLRQGKRFYEINREHPLIKSIMTTLNGEVKELNQLLRFVEETVPVSLITIKESEQPELQGQAFDDTDQEPVRKAMRQLYEMLIKDGKPEEEAKSVILNIEPFNLYPQFAEHLK